LVSPVIIISPSLKTHIWPGGINNRSVGGSSSRKYRVIQKFHHYASGNFDTICWYNCYTPTRHRCGRDLDSILYTVSRVRTLLVTCVFSARSTCFYSLTLLFHSVIYRMSECV
jgi:hypothetical protein